MRHAAAKSACLASPSNPLPTPDLFHKKPRTPIQPERVAYTQSYSPMNYDYIDRILDLANASDREQTTSGGYKRGKK